MLENSRKGWLELVKYEDIYETLLLIRDEQHDLKKEIAVLKEGVAGLNEQRAAFQDLRDEVRDLKRFDTEFTALKAEKRANIAKLEELKIAVLNQHTNIKLLCALEAASLGGMLGAFFKLVFN